MSYEANKIKWSKNSIVIHHADEKSPKMLMLVLGYTRDGLCKTQYINDTRIRTIWKNDIAYLLDPQSFEIKPYWGYYRNDLYKEVIRNWERVKNWNLKFDKDEKIHFLDGGGELYSNVRGKAYMDQSGTGMIWVEGKGNCALDFITPLRHVSLIEKYTKQIVEESI